MFMINELHAGLITLCARSTSSPPGIARTSKNKEATIEDETDDADTKVAVVKLSQVSISFVIAAENLLIKSF